MGVGVAVVVGVGVGVVVTDGVGTAHQHPAGFVAVGLVHVGLDTHR